jgi:MarR family transcriptional regulator for hemolysin
MDDSVERPAHEALFSLMAQVTRQWRRVLDRRLQPLGMTQATWLALLYLARAGSPLRQKELAASMALDTSSLVRLLDRLQADGLVQRQADAGDRRAHALSLTDRGRVQVGKVEAVVRQARAEVLRDFDLQGLQVAHGVLAQLALKMESVLEGNA